ncbi:MAG: beta-lactamase family protein [Acidobacteriaceae bacterium]|nr:beta-lactamase family protein [Acidobacteriaceae bacterium]MBV9780414.1 beta-lactamase family protein [Acidobacteriaceae bacterium]
MSLKFRFVYISVFFTGVLLSACMRSGTKDVTAKMEEYMRALEKLHQFSGSVLVAKDGRPLIRRGYGMADFEWAAPNQPNTKFRIGSITKQFTSMAIMMLQERGQLSVRDRMCKYVAGCPASWQPITIDQLLTHTSGIPDFTDFQDYKRIERFPITPEALVNSFKDKPLDFPPGAKFSYSNSGYAVLGLIIEQVSHRSYSVFLKEEIFTPLGMKDSGYDSNDEIIEHRASGYVRKSGAIRNATYIDMTVPYAAGGLYSTVEDLLRWDQALYTEKLVSQKSLTAMFTPHVAIAGYGWAIETQFGRKMISHEGGIEGFVSKIARFPDEHTTIIVLSNLETAAITKISKDLAAIVFGEKYELPHEQQFIHMDPAKLNRYAGRYQVQEAPDVIVTISVKGQSLLFGVQGESLVLRPESETKFEPEDGSAQVEFVEDAAHNVTSLIFNGQFKAKKLQ